MTSTDKTWRDAPPDLLAQAAAFGDDHLDAFFAVVERIPAGQQFTSNDVRAALDELAIPNTKRGGLFVAAQKAGLIERVGMSAWGTYAQLYQPSSGRSAKHARVARWRRAKAELVGTDGAA